MILGDLTLFRNSKQSRELRWRQTFLHLILEN